MAGTITSNRILNTCKASTPWLVCVVVAASVLCLGGCYQRTVSARGIGAASHEVSEPYQESGQLDDWIFGPTNDSKQQTPMNRNSSRLR